MILYTFFLSKESLVDFTFSWGLSLGPMDAEQKLWTNGSFSCYVSGCLWIGEGDS